MVCLNRSAPNCASSPLSPSPGCRGTKRLLPCNSRALRECCRRRSAGSLVMRADWLLSPLSPLPALPPRCPRSPPLLLSSKVPLVSRCVCARLGSLALAPSRLSGSLIGLCSRLPLALLLPRCGLLSPLSSSDPLLSSCMPPKPPLALPLSPSGLRSPPRSLLSPLSPLWCWWP
jgi:hypothetical protein